MLMDLQNEQRTASYLRLISGEKRGVSASAFRRSLRAASWTYGSAAWLRNRCFDWGWRQSAAASVPVISVGNLTVGGTGKTPCVEYIARFLHKSGIRVAILSRGYGSNGGPNDEALLLATNLPDVPHLQGPDRVSLANEAVTKFDSQVLILDDGFQHRRLQRTLDVVLIDATEAWGYGHLLPRGLLRESPRELRRADAVLLAHCDQVRDQDRQQLTREIRNLSPHALVVETEHRPLEWLVADGGTRPLDEVSGDVAAFCGIGNPDTFRRTIHSIGLMIREFRAFPDHHHYDPVELESWARQLPQGRPILTTQKDLVKLKQTKLAGHDLLAVRIDLSIQKGEEALRQMITNVVPAAAQLSI
jgi:tetraacyldisaccharide 4'-kinase